MELMTKEIKDLFANTWTQDGNDPTVIVKFFTPWANWTWYATEYNPKDRIFYWYVVWTESEWGEFSLDELESLEWPLWFKIERDIHFSPKKFSKISM